MLESLECTSSGVSMPLCRNRISYGNEGVVVSVAEACGDRPGLWLEIALAGDAPQRGAALCAALPLTSPDEDRIRFAATVCAWARACREIAAKEGPDRPNWLDALVRTVAVLGVGHGPSPIVSSALQHVH